MSSKLDKTMELANTYASFYVEDFVGQVMDSLRGSHSVPHDVRDTMITAKMVEIKKTPLKINNTNTVGRFLYECAEFALEHNLPEIGERGTWNLVAGLPSIHHKELSVITHKAADLYRTTMGKTVIGTIARDADTTAKLIGTTIQNRINVMETGGNVHQVSWGILDDGLWLNGALLQAADKARIFKPDQTPAVSWFKQAFDAAHQTVKTPRMETVDRETASAELNLLLGNAGSEVVDPLLSVFDQIALENLIFRSGNLGTHLDHWEKGSKDTAVLIESLSEMSAVVKLLGTLKEMVNLQDDPDTISDFVKTRINLANDSVTMALVGYEALRETRFADTLIMRVDAKGDDPKVDVFVNADTIGQYHAANGSDDDLLQFGFHLDPRKGMPVSSNGWKMQYVMDSRDTVVPSMMAKEAERLTQMRANDASVIRNETRRLVSDVVQSYLSARDIEEIPNKLRQDIGRLSQDIVAPNSDVRLDERISTLLADAIGDTFVQKATQSFVSHLHSDSGLEAFASSATIIDLAMDDVVDNITSITG